MGPRPSKGVGVVARCNFGSVQLELKVPALPMRFPTRGLNDINDLALEAISLPDW